MNMNQIFEVYGGRVMKMLVLILASGSLFLLAQFANSLKEWETIGRDISPQATIFVSGEGEAFAVPDIAEFSFSVVKEAQTVPEAQKLSAESSNAIIEFLKNSGIEEKDIKTVNYSVNPKYEWRRDIQPQIVCVRAPCPQPPISSNQVLIGYEVNQTVSIKVRKVDDAGTLLSGVGERGATNVSGIQFTVDDPEAMQRQARQEAIEKAEVKAKELAKDLGVRLVRIISFSESGGQGPIFFGKAAGMEMAAMGMGGDAAIAPDIAPGENRVSTTITITYEIR